MKPNALRSVVEFIKRRPLVALLIAVAALVLVWYVGSSLRDGIAGASVDRQVTRTEAQADAAEATAADAISEAGEANVERRVEDAVREQTIKPQIERAARRSEDASARRRAAERTNEAHQNFRPVDLDDRLLRERNCAELAELYPGQQFPGCGVYRFRGPGR